MAQKRTEMHTEFWLEILFGKPTPTNDESTEMDLKGTGWDEIEWIHLAQDRDKWLEVNLWIN
jgi:hypothetical protein